MRVNENIFAKHTSICLTVQVAGYGSMHGGGVVIAHGGRMAASWGECGAVGEQLRPHKLVSYYVIIII